MTNAIEKGLDILFKKCSVDKKDVDIIERSDCLYCVYDELSGKYSLPFIVSDDNSASRAIYDVMRSGNPEENFYFRFQKTYYLVRICVMSGDDIGLPCLETVMRLDDLYEKFANMDMAHLKDYFKRGIQPIEQENKEIDLPIKEEVSNGKE